MHTINRRMGGALFFFIGAFAALATGCGGATHQAVTPGSDATTATPQPKDVPDAMSQVDQAEAELGQALSQLSIGSGLAKPKESEERVPAVQPAPTTSPAEAPAGTAAPDRASTVDPCATACRALASMSRSVEHVCDLAGEGDEQCANARARVGRANDRVRAQCPACS